ncbi:MAG: CoA-binding protein, partial [Planctomycetes bacterium]|nr:CoA-binding protein [Planctomycetota bacterium]
MDERQKRLDRAFSPRSIAFVGATEASAKWGFIIFNNLIVGGFRGDLYPVNPNRDEVMGMKAFGSVRDVPGDIDLAVITVPAAHVVPAVKDCAARGVQAAVVVSAGFRELGGESARMEEELVRVADGARMAVVGPNGQGICCPSSGLYPWMPLFYPPAGSIGFVCQSGNILNMLIGHALDAGFGVSKAVSSGNEAQLKTEDFVEYMARDADTQVVAAYIEGVEDGRRFLEKARAATAAKPVVALKGGRSESGSAAARSHTGAMAVSERMFEAACRQAGVVLTRTIGETGLTAASFVNRPLPGG